MTSVVLAPSGRLGTWPALVRAGMVGVGALLGTAVAQGGGARVAAVLVSLALAGLCLHLRWPVAAFYAAAGAVLLPLPGIQDLRAPVLGGSLYPSDVLVPAAALAAFRRCRFSARALAPAALALGVVLVGVAAFAVHGSPLAAFLTDLRGPVHLTLGVVVGLAAARDLDVRAALGRAFALILWISALAALVTSVTGLHLVAGPVQEVSTNIAGTETRFGVLRFQLAPSLASSVTLCVVAGFALIHRDRSVVRRAVLRYGPPSAVLVFLSFARNSLLALALATAFSLLVGVRTGQVRRAAARVLALGVVAGLGAVAVFALTEVATRVAGAARNPVEAQVSAYRGRVLDVLGGDKLKNDSSASFRSAENRYAVAAIRRRPLAGSGFGAAYRPRFRLDPFSDARGTRYAHNYYLWIAVKTGLVGLALSLTLFTWPLLRFLRRRRGATRRWEADVAPLLAGLVGALGILFVAPAASAPGFASVFGCLLGFLWAWRPGRGAASSPLWVPPPSTGSPEAHG